MTGAQDFLVTVELLHQFVEGALDGGSWACSLFLDSQLSGWQAQVQGNASSLARRALIEKRLQMDEFWAEDLESFPEFFDLVGDFFFEVGSLRNFIADVNVHENLERGKKIP